MSKDIDLENMSDEDFLNAPAPAPEEVQTPVSTGSTLEDALDAPVPVAETPVPTEEDETGNVADTALEGDHTTPKHTEAEEKIADPSEEKAEDDPEDETAGDDKFQDDAPKKVVKDTPAADPKDGDDDPEAKAPKEEPATETIDYKSEYEKLMAPFKANGKDFKVDTPDEAVRLMQMGANYTKKMQSLAPNLKLMRMLDNNDLLTEDKIAFMIDLNGKDPAAIQKLMHDSKIDPMDIDAAETPTYKKGDHTVSDQEMTFHDVLGDVSSSPTGKETINLIDKHWDEVSKAAVYNEPTILKIIDTQRANGIFDQISAEIDRQKTLGDIPPNTPFIEAYKTVGDTLHKANKLIQTSQTSDVQNPKPAANVIETRTAARKPTVANGEKAKAASSVKSSAKVPPKAFDPINMTDEQIMAITSPTG